MKYLFSVRYICFHRENDFIFWKFS